MNLYHYHLMVFPLDWEFCFLSVNEYKELITEKHQQTSGYSQYLAGDLTDVLDKINNTYNIAWQQYTLITEKAGVSGKLRCDPMIVPLPSSNQDGSAEFIIIFKMDNDGDTFVFSPIPLPHLENCE